MSIRISIEIGDEDLRRFRSALRDSKKVVDTRGEAAVLAATRSAVEDLQSAGLPEFVSSRLQRLHLLVDMVSDERWRMPAADRAHVMSALAYFSEPNDLIPDDVPVFGLLDDAILVELVLRQLRHEIQAYEEFLSFGRVDKEGPQSGSPPAVSEVEFRERRERLRRRIRRRSNRDRERRRGAAVRSSLW